MLKQLINRLFAREPKQWAKQNTPWFDQHPETYEELNYEKWKNQVELKPDTHSIPKGCREIEFDPALNPVFPDFVGDIYAQDGHKNYRGIVTENSDFEWYIADPHSDWNPRYENLSDLMSAYHRIRYKFYFRVD